MIGKQIDMWSHLKKLGEAADVELYKLVGRDRSGGHSADVFANNPPVALECVVRPWQQDLNRMADEGQTGHTPGFKMYVSASANVARNDRVHWDGGAFRVVNPQHDDMADIVRWDIRTDDRELIHESDVPTQVDLEPPNRDRFGGY